MFDYLNDNKQWIFSGVGVALALGMIAVLRWALRSRNPASGTTQAQRTGQQSTAIQAGRDVLINTQPAPDQPSVRVSVHRAYLQGDSNPRFFVNVVNDANGAEVEITHVWYAGTRRVDILEPSRPLPRRLRPAESWETHVPVAAVPTDTDLYRNFRVLLSTDQTFASEERRDVPPQGFVPGA